MVWVPPSTGSHTGGRWVEVPDGGRQAGSFEREKSAAPKQLRREH